MSISTTEMPASPSSHTRSTSALSCVGARGRVRGRVRVTVTVRVRLGLGSPPACGHDAARLGANLGDLAPREARVGAERA